MSGFLQRCGGSSSRTGESPVVYGSVIGDGGRGGLFRLADDRTFKLSADECRIVRPRWAFRQELEAR
jgi:hypothetical protein